MLDDVVKRFGAVDAVDHLNLAVGRGEFFSLLGPSGCGKTTTLRLIGGFEEPTSGRIVMDGDDVTKLPPYDRESNTVFQAYALFPHLTVEANISFGLKRRGVDKDNIARRVRSIVELVGLRGLEHRRPTQLSGGQQQRVAVARALVNEPKVLLLDEPLGALDLKLRRQMQIELKRIQTEVGITFIFVTHDQDEAMTMSDRIAVMSAGRIEQLGTPQEVYDRPRTAFVAGFLGASNLLTGTVSDPAVAGSNVRLLAGGTVVVPVERRAGETLQVGVRPEKVRILAAGEGSPGLNVVDGTVVTAAFVGLGWQLVCAVNGSDAFSVNAANDGDSSAPRVGDPIRLAWRPEHTFVLEPAPAVT